MPEQVLAGAPMHLMEHHRSDGAQFQADRRQQGRPLVDDPWRATAEFVVGANGLIRLSWAYQACEDFPDPQVPATATQLA